MAGEVLFARTYRRCVSAKEGHSVRLTLVKGYKNFCRYTLSGNCTTKLELKFIVLIAKLAYQI